MHVTYNQHINMLFDIDVVLIFENSITFVTLFDKGINSMIFNSLWEGCYENSGS
jgi:hypothetical protein